MAEPITIQKLIEASMDSDSLEVLVNGDENTDVSTRLGESYPSAKKAINTLFTNGGLPAQPFATKALMTASALVDGKYAQVTDDKVVGAKNNGLYLKTSGAWVKSDYEPSEQARKQAEEVVNAIVTINTGKNKYNPDTKLTGFYVNSASGIYLAEGWSVSDFIPVIAGQTYTVSATSRRVGLAFFASKQTSGIAGTYNSTAFTVVVTAPANAKYLVINIDSTSVVGSNVQVELGAVATTYEPYVQKPVIKTDIMPEGIIFSDDLQSAIDGINTQKDYEVMVASKNLFNKSAIIIKQYLASTDGSIVSRDTLGGWATSDFIPVVAGQTYTLSGARGRAGLSFFTSKTNTTSSISYINTSTLPLTVTAPTGANFVMFNIYYPDNQTYNNLMFEKGDSASDYEIFGDYLAIDAKYITSTDLTPSTPASLSKFEVFANNAARIHTVSDIKLQLDLLLTKPNTHDDSTVFNFAGDRVDGATLRTLNDDVSPLRLDGTTIGANHGYTKTVITSTAHGKTNAEVGSVWTDGTAQFVIIDIPSVDKISVTARTSNIALTANSLTHISGAANTTAINSTSKISNQWYPAIKNRQLKIFVDGAKIDASIVSSYDYKDNVALHESYEIMAKSDIVEWIIVNKGIALSNYDAAASVLYNNSYVFDKDGGCVIYTSVTAYKSVPFQDYMGTQSVPISSTTRFYYVPKTIAFTQDSVNYDFTKLQNMSVAPVSSIVFFPNKNEIDTNPVDRLVQFNATVGYATGYLPLLDAEPSKRLTNASKKYLEIRGGTLKVYPSLIDTASKTTLDAGDSFSGIAYRKYFKRDNFRTAKYVVRSQIADFLYLDWHTAKTDTVELPDDLIGRTFTVHEKSSNVTVLSKFATNNIAVKIDSTKSYGYLVLRFDR